MTRFMMTLEDAVDLVIYAFQHGRNGEIFVQKSPAATVGTLAQALISLLGKPGHPIKTIGTRHGEKLYEALLSREEMFRAEDLGRYFRISPDARDLNYAKYTEKGNVMVSNAADGDGYTSHNTDQLDIESMRKMLLKLEIVKRLTGENAE
jgi:UDP-N-acetylglucosamine 4,6-dehydratase